MTKEERKERIAWVTDCTSSDAWESRRMKMFGEKMWIEGRNDVIEEILEQVEAYPMYPEEKQRWRDYLNAIKKV